MLKSRLVNKCNPDRLFAETVASGATELRLVKLLLEKMSGPVIGLSLFPAARYGHIEVVKLLLGKSEPWHIYYALEAAAKAGQVNVVGYLRQWCAPVQIRTIHRNLFTFPFVFFATDRVNMAELPLLAAVTLALPSRLQVIDHILHLINHFLVPATIDAAVYLELTRVSKVFRIFRPLTVGAMDGAASRGRLDILRHLHANRSEGCSTAAFNGAAANNHLQVLQWLFVWYEGSCNLKEAVVSAAAAGHLRVVKFLSTPSYQLGRVARLRPLEYQVVVEAAVLNSQIEVLEYLLNFDRGHPYRRRGIVSAVNAAAKNGLTGVMQFLLRTCNVIWLDHFDFQYNYHGLQYAAAAGHSDIVALLMKNSVYSVVSVDASVEKAAEAGHMNVVFMLLSRCGESGVVQALKAAVANNRHTLAEFLIRLCSPWQVASVISTGDNDQRKLFEL
ncbi:putative ankyrin repeat protein [Phytophthora citrophthora]|uniref:Ankyrin repeat protein n=1 Tax=Phytophthora citrophthora TaxID=4793 RepID=A0AAD9GRG8_9STRA|nr:putative ankyrin repeat protein [Phytophthora citrophthora]